MTKQGQNTPPGSRAVQENADCPELNEEKKERSGPDTPAQNRKIIRAVTDRVGAKGTVGNRVDQQA